MIKTLENFSIVDVLSDSLKKDNNIRNLAIALTPIFQKLLEQTKLVQMYRGIPDHLLDFIAYEVAADFYDVNMTNNQKRITLVNAESIHKSKGTVAAVEDVIAPFFNTGRVREWFEYDGKPYHFQVIANEHLENEDDIAKLFRMVDIVKRESTRLDSVIFERKDGVVQEAVQTNDHIKIYPLANTFLCGQWPNDSTLGRIIESGLNVRTDSVDKTISKYKQANTFFLNSDVSPETIYREYKDSLEFSMNKNLSFVEYVASREDLNLNFITGSKEEFEQFTISTNSSMETNSTSDKSVINYQLAGQFYAGEG
ncbi:phage tail protein I [Salmonella enterica subsp. enterica]|nr:phage tail protein I [Salmonella enterica subsp. enterica serovar Paratyphi A]